MKTVVSQQTAVFVFSEGWLAAGVKNDNDQQLYKALS